MATTPRKTHHHAAKVNSAASRRKSLAAFLRGARLRSGHSQLDVAQKMGYGSSQFISNWERGLSSPPCNALWKLATLYSVSAEELYDLMLDEALARVEEGLREEFFQAKPLKKA